MGDRKTDAELVQLLQLKRELKSNAKVAAHTGVGVSTVQARMADAKSRGLTADTKAVDPLAKAHVAIKLLERKLAAAQHEEDTAESIRRTIYGLADVSPEPPKWLTKSQSSGTPGAPMTIWSDWHYGEVVRPAEVGGLNAFNSTIAAQRIQKLVDRTIRLSKGFAFKERGKDVKFPGIVVCLGGDMISGDIHEELADTNDRKPLECINELLDLLIAGITQLADAFGAVFVPCVVGNHGRTSRKPRMKGRVITSYEWNLYTNLERWFRNDPRVSFFVSDEADVLFHCMGHRFLLTHGDSLGTKGGDGMIGAIGPILRGTMKVGRSYAQINKDYDTIVMGHWHQEIQIPGLCVNNALKGYDEYAMLQLRAPYSRPGQNLWFVHPEQGVTARLQVYVDDIKKPKKAPDWVVVPGR